MVNNNEFLKKIDELVFYLDDISGIKLYRDLNKEDLALINKDKELSEAYLILQFLIIPFLHTEQITTLLAEHLIIGLMIKDISLIERITKKLLLMDLTDRDKCKNTLNNALLENKETIIKEVRLQNKKIITASDWIRDYLSQVGLKEIKSLEQAKYFSEQNYVVNLKDEDKENLQKIIDLYNFLNTSSLTPEGFEDDLILKDREGRVFTTNNGQIAVLYDPKKIVKKPVVKVSEDKIIKNVVSEKRLAPSAKGETENDLAELKQLAASYPSGSLERKAVEEEIEKVRSKK